MKLTADKFFVDSNVFLYLLSNIDWKKEIAEQILTASPVISTQVVIENINVGLKKLTMFSPYQIAQHSDTIIKYLQLVLVNEDTINIAFSIKGRYRLQWFDSLIVASAVQNDCKVLYSEDMQHQQRIDNVTIINPFAE